MRRMRARYYKYILFFIKMQLKNLDNNKNQNRISILNLQTTLLK